jgi:hypothetical protein
MDPLLRRYERQAIDLARIDRRGRAAEHAGIAFDQARAFVAHDPRIQAALELARRYQDDTGKIIKAAAGGWPQMVNYATPGSGTALNTFTTQAVLSPVQEPNINSGTTQAGTMFHIGAIGIVGDTTVAPTWQLGVALNGSATASWITAATSQVAVSQTAQAWQMIANLMVLTAGATGTINGSGNVSGLSTTTVQVQMPVNEPAAPTWNTAQSNFLSLTAACGTSNAANSITCQGLFVVQMN